MKIKIDGRTVGYSLEGKGPCIVFSHSLGCDRRMWDSQVQAFKDRFTVLRYDIRGHGESEAGSANFDLDDLAQDVESLLHTLDVDEAHIAGISLGGLIAQHLALRNKRLVRSLVLADTTGKYPTAAREMWLQRSQLVLKPGGMSTLIAPTLQRWFTEECLIKNGGAVVLASQMLSSTSPEGYSACCLALRDADTLERLQALCVPVLVIVGELDQGTPVEFSRELQAHLKRAELSIIPAAAHLSSMEKPEEFNTRLMNFFSKNF